MGAVQVTDPVASSRRPPDHPPPLARRTHHATVPATATFATTTVAVRDSKTPALGTVTSTAPAWSAFLGALASGVLR